MKHNNIHLLFKLFLIIIFLIISACLCFNMFFRSKKISTTTKTDQEQLNKTACEEIRAKHSIKNWPCIKDKNFARDENGSPIWLESEELMKRLISYTKLELPMLGHGHMKGEITVDVFINEDGEVECLRAVEGQPLAMKSVFDQVPKWKFKPYKIKEKPIPFLGTLIILYEFKK